MDDLIFAPEDNDNKNENRDTYKILIVDDDKEVHSFTKLALKGFIYKNRTITFISAYSAQEAKEYLDNIDDIAVMLLDVVMESNSAGLEVVEYTRRVLVNDMVRIIIRTGQAGEAPERYVIDNYDINDYKEKTELTTDKLYITIRTALSQYSQLEDILKKKNELYNLLITDKLTSLPNRVKLNYDLDTQEPKTLMLIDIDGFSLLNDAYGFELGDEVLLHLVDIITPAIKRNMQLYHLEADLYAILIEQDIKEDISDEVNTIKSLLDNSPLEANKLMLHISVTIGVVHFEVGNIIQKAEIALRQARRVSKNRVEYYSNSLDMIHVIEENSSWTFRIAKALEKDKLLTYFQPIIECSSGKIVKYETLVRLEHEGTVYAPFYFLKTARYAGYLNKITRRVFDKACAKFADNDLRFSINITDHDLTEDKFISYIEETRQKYNIESSRIIFEILEETSVSNNVRAIENLKKISELGYALSIDDFGTECSNFAQLGNNSYESIKIDGKFIKDIDSNKQSRIITESILFFTSKVGFDTVAEFVHSKEIYDIVKSLGITYAQGYYLGEPKPELIEV